MKRLILINYLLIIYFKLINSLQYELSILVDPGRRECFHQFFRANLNIESDYQVIHGGELDITFWIINPINTIIFSEQQKNGGQTQFKTDKDGEYQFCFDNSFSRFAPKQVFFYVASIEAFDDPHLKQDPLSSVELNELRREKIEDFEESLEGFKESFTKVTSNLERAQRIQSLFKAYEMKDRTLMEQSFERVNFWSLVNILVLVGVGFLQVYMIRSLFEDKSAIGRALRK